MMLKRIFKYFSLAAMLVLVLFPIIIGFAVFRVELKMIQKQVKHKIMAGIPKSVLTQFTWQMHDRAFAQLEWEKEDEFKYQGNMYDVVASDTLNGCITFYCFLDKKESLLKYNFNTLLKDSLTKDKNKQKNRTHLFNFMQSLYVKLDFITLARLEVFFIPIKSYYTFHLKTFQLVPLTPPPNM